TTVAGAGGFMAFGRCNGSARSVGARGGADPVPPRRLHPYVSTDRGDSSCALNAINPALPGTVACQGELVAGPPAAQRQGLAVEVATGLAGLAGNGAGGGAGRLTGGEPRPQQGSGVLGLDRCARLRRPDDQDVLAARWAFLQRGARARQGRADDLLVQFGEFTADGDRPVAERRLQIGEGGLQAVRCLVEDEREG